MVMAEAGPDPEPTAASAGAAAPTPTPKRPRVRRARGIWVLAIIAVIAVVVPGIAIQTKRTELRADLEHRLGILSRGRAEVIGAWLEGQAHPIGRLVESEMVRLFATEMDLARADMADMAAGAGNGKPTAGAGDGAGVNVPLAAQIPFMSQVLSDFTRAEGFLAGYLINRDGVAYVTSAGASELSPAQAAVAARAMSRGALVYGAARLAKAGLVLDLFAPIFPAQGEAARGEPVGVALLSVPLGARLSAFLAPPPLARPGERLKLLQLFGGELFQIAPGESPPLRSVGGLELSDPNVGLPFARRGAIGEGTEVLSVGTAVPGPAWWVVQEIDAVAVNQRLNGFIAAAVALAVLVVLAVAAAFGAFWWRMANEHSAALAEQYRRLAARIDAQKRLLDSINNTITDYIGLKALDGTYTYLNPAFARAMGREVETSIGLDDTAIYGKGTADRLKHSDRRALTSGAAVTVHEEVYLNKCRRHLQITKVPYRDESGAVSGLVSVTRDVTELVEAQQRRERATRQTVAALARAVELRDPYLAGHSRRLAGFAVAVAQRLGASPDETATVEIAANLSQIGKLGIPRQILAKPDRLSAAEIVEMRKHLDHAATILRDMDFGLPVLDAIQQMHERLDGGGYPKGLAGARIGRAGRILGACDVFCARVEPRSYRDGISADEALHILESNAERYDTDVVAALRAVAESIAGEKLMADVGAA